MKYAIEKNLLELTLQYLMSKPYREVEGLVQALARLPLVEAPKLEAVVKAPTDEKSNS